MLFERTDYELGIEEARGWIAQYPRLAFARYEVEDSVGKNIAYTACSPLPGERKRGRIEIWENWLRGGRVFPIEYLAKHSHWSLATWLETGFYGEVYEYHNRPLPLYELWMPIPVGETETGVLDHWRGLRIFPYGEDLFRNRNPYTGPFDAMMCGQVRGCAWEKSAGVS